MEIPAATMAPAMPENRLFGAPQVYSDSSKGAGGPAQPPAPANAQAPAQRLVIENAELTIVVQDVGARVQAIHDMASAMGGFLVSENVYQATVIDDEPILQGQIVVRVPHEKLDDAIKQIKQGTVDVKNENRTGTDVTDQYVDLQSRLTAKQAAEQQLLKIMQDANKTQDVLDVYAQLQQVQSDIEVLKGQIKYYEQSAALSMISVTVIAEKTVKPLQVAGWKPQGVARDALQSLIYFWQDFVNFLIRFVLYILPVLLTLAIPLYLFFLLLRWILRKTRRPTAAAPVEVQKK